MNKKNKILLLFVFVTTVIVLTLSFSKYRSTMALKSSTKIGMPVVNFKTNTLMVDIDPLDKEKDYIFEVSNYDDNKESEVKMKYNVQVKNYGMLPLEFEMYNYDGENITGENLLTNNISSEIIMGVDKKENNKYILKIKWKENSRNYLYSKEIDYVQIVLNSEQVD